MCLSFSREHNVLDKRFYSVEMEKNLAVKILEDQFLARIKGFGFFMALHSTVLKVHRQIVFLFGLMNIKMKKLSYSKNQ